MYLFIKFTVETYSNEVLFLNRDLENTCELYSLGWMETKLDKLTNGRTCEVWRFLINLSSWAFKVSIVSGVSPQTLFLFSNVQPPLLSWTSFHSFLRVYILLQLFPHSFSDNFCVNDSSTLHPRPGSLSQAHTCDCSLVNACLALFCGYLNSVF